MLERHARLVVEPVRQAARMDLKRAARPSLSESVLEQLLSAFREGKLKPGVRLPSEYELSAMLGVGRSSVREAMRVLTFMGLIETKPGRGAVVLTGLQNPVPPTGAAGAVQRSAMRDLYEVRSVLEGGAAAIAAKRATLADLVAMERAARIIEARVARGRPYFRENVEFHLAIARATHNHILLESVRRLLAQLPGLRQQVTAPVPGFPARDVKEHRAIVQAIRGHRHRRAQVLMERHIGSVIRATGLDAVGKSPGRPPTRSG